MKGLRQSQGNATTSSSNPFAIKLKPKTTSVAAIAASTSNALARSKASSSTVTIDQILDSMNRELNATKPKKLKRSMPENYSDLDEDDLSEWDEELYITLEQKLCFKDIKNTVEDLKDYDRVFYLIKLLQLRRLNEIEEEKFNENEKHDHNLLNLQPYF